MKIGIGSSETGTLLTQLPQGAVYDSYNMYVSIEIVDQDDGISYYAIQNPIVVAPNMSLVNSMIDKLISAHPKLPQNVDLFKGDSQLTIQTILSISSVLNGQSLSDKKALVSSNISK
jgi:hypothetical protein